MCRALHCEAFGLCFTEGLQGLLGPSLAAHPLPVPCLMQSSMGLYQFVQNAVKWTSITVSCLLCHEALIRPCGGNVHEYGRPFMGCREK